MHSPAQTHVASSVVLHDQTVRQPRDSVLRGSRPVLLQDLATPGGATVVEGEIEIPVGVYALRRRADEVAVLCARDAGPGRASFLVELTCSSNAWRLLLFVGPRAAAMINGVAAAPVSPLACGDVLRLGSGPALHVSMRRELVIELPPPHVIGRACSVCLRPIEPQQVVHVCACGSARHAETPDHFWGNEPLECLLLSCPDCGRGVPAGGLAYRPTP